MSHVHVSVAVDTGQTPLESDRCDQSNKVVSNISNISSDAESHIIGLPGIDRHNGLLYELNSSCSSGRGSPNEGTQCLEVAATAIASTGLQDALAATATADSSSSTATTLKQQN